MFLSFPDGHGVVELFLWSRGDSWKLTRGLADVCYNNLALGRNLPHVTWREAFIAKRAPEKRSAWSFCTCCSTCSSALTGLSLSSLRTPHGGHRSVRPFLTRSLVDSLTAWLTFMLKLVITYHVVWSCVQRQLLRPLDRTPRENTGHPHLLHCILGMRQDAWDTQWARRHLLHK